MKTKSYLLTMEVTVFDEGMLLAAAKGHANAQGTEFEGDDVGEALIMILDPGGGGDAYAGNLNEIGIQVEQSTAEHVSEGYR